MKSDNTVQLQLEREVLGSLLFMSPHQRGKIMDALERIEPRDFTAEAHQIIYTVLVDLFVRRNAIDVVMLTSELQRAGSLGKIGGAVYLTELSAVGVSDSEYRIEALRERSRIRRAKDACQQMVQRYEDGDFESWADPVEELQSSLYAIRHEHRSTAVDLHATADKIIAQAKNLGNTGIVGYSWGLKKLDWLTSGIEPGKTYVVGAVKKSGKSKFVVNTIHSLVGQRVKSLFLSLEMDGEGVVRELLSRFAGASNTSLKRQLVPELEYRFREAADRLAEGWITVDPESFLSVNQVRLKVRAAAQAGIKVVFIDYLQRMNFQLREKRELNFATVVAHTVTQLADIAKENDVALIFLSQLAARAEGEQADLSHLKDSGGIAEGVDGILILNNQDRVKRNYQNKSNEVWITVEQRSGQSGMVKCTVDLSQALYEERDGAVPVGIPVASTSDDGDDVFEDRKNGDQPF